MDIVASTGPSLVGLLLAPLHALVGFFAPWQSGGSAAGALGQGKSAQAASAQAHSAAIRTSIRTAPRSVATPVVVPRNARLRVIRVVDHCPQPVERLRISGRMADVCAELDRLAQAENARRA